MSFVFQLQGCEAVENLSKAKNATYMSRTAGEDFQAAVAEDLHTRAIEVVKSGKFFSVLIDESTDIAVNKHLVVYFRVVDPSMVPKTFFFKNVTIKDPKSDAKVLFETLKKSLEEDGLPTNKIIGFGSDGASVMVGRHNSVSSKIKKLNPFCINIHCMAHRLNLATSQASRNITFMKTVESTLSDLFKYFGGSKSGNRKCALEQVQKVLNDPILKIKECHEIRWIAFMEAVRTVFLCWKSILTYFQNEKSSKASEFINVMSQYKFVMVLALLMDILPSVAQLSLVLQKSDLDISCIYPCLNGLLQDIQAARK